MAEYFLGKVDSGYDPHAAAVDTIRYFTKALAEQALHPPKSSDWLALPRWAARVAGYAALIDKGGTRYTTQYYIRTIIKEST